MAMTARVVDEVGDEVFVDITPDSDVAELCEAVAQAKAMHVSEVKVAFNGEVWTDPHLKLAETGWDCDDELRLVVRPLFRPGMRLEARDRMTVGYLCVATIAEVDGRRVKVHFDGWTDKYDYWTDDDHQDLAPIGTCKRLGYFLEGPKGFASVEGPWRGFMDTFDSWEAYLATGPYEAAPEVYFARLDVEYFEGGAHKDAVSRQKIFPPEENDSSDGDAFGIDGPAPGMMHGMTRQMS
eukprot:TRINITY_DN289_c0_g2_i1.p1 TRINITY_DN289_c0_g2~~TRINITY_DN289_c0_g2_i1.p1  ORF type:complete len:238 (+),score=85.31 TRINITY_DN289_c0_g2_i1:67-780(+)